MESTNFADRERLIRDNMDYARNVAVKTARTLPIEIEDAIQCAYEGLCKAAERFDFEQYDPERGDLETNFKSFAHYRIYGAIVDQARRNTFVRRSGLKAGIRIHMDSLDRLTDLPHGGETPAIQLEALNPDLDGLIDFEDAWATLTPKEQDILMSLAVGVSGQKLATKYGVTSSRISQISGEARTKLERKMALA